MAQWLDQFAETLINRLAAMHLRQADGARPIHQNLLLFRPHAGNPLMTIYDKIRQNVLGVVLTPGEAGVNLIPVPCER